MEGIVPKEGDIMSYQQYRELVSGRNGRDCTQRRGIFAVPMKLSRWRHRLPFLVSLLSPVKRMIIDYLFRTFKKIQFFEALQVDKLIEKLL